MSVPESARHPGIVAVPADGLLTPYGHYRPHGPGPGGVYLGEMAVVGPPPAIAGDPAALAAWWRNRDPRFMSLVSAHEAVPGHHLQFAVAALVTRPYRGFAYDTLFVEGWALYSEQLLADASRSADPVDRLALLRMRLWRALRVIIDAGIHTGRLRPSAAVRMLTDEVLLDRPSAEAEVMRYLGSPTQPLSYMIGRNTIEAIRRAVVRDGRAETARAFHDRLLAFGPIPLEIAAAVLMGKRAAYDHLHR